MKNKLCAALSGRKIIKSETVENCEVAEFEGLDHPILILYVGIFIAVGGKYAQLDEDNISRLVECTEENEITKKGEYSANTSDHDHSGLFKALSNTNVVTEMVAGIEVESSVLLHPLVACDAGTFISVGEKYVQLTEDNISRLVEFDSEEEMNEY